MASATAARVASEDVRARVLHGAVKLIEKDGLAGVSMREVARVAGVSHQAPYHYFADREAIFAALAEHGFTILADLLEATMKGGGSAIDRLLEAARVYVNFAFDHAALFRIMFRRDIVTLDRFPVVQECGDRAFQIVPLLIRDCIEEGLPAEPSGEALVVLAWSLPHGLACLILDGPLEKKLPDLFANRDAMIRDVLRAMRHLLVSGSSPKRPQKAAKVAVKAKPKPVRRKAR